MFCRTLIVVVVSAIAVPGINTPLLAQTAEEAAASCVEASRLIAENDVAGALDEAQWCVESLRQIKQNRTLTLFPESVEGFTGGAVENQSAMGMTVIERVYERDGKRLSVTLTSGIAGGGLAALAQFASGLSGAGGAKMRIQKRTVIDMSEQSGQAEFMVQLKSGGVLNISSSDLAAESVVEFIKSFPIADLDDSLS